MNRYRYLSVNQTLMALTVAQVLRHHSVHDVFGMVSALAPRIKVVYGRPINGEFVRASEIENMMDSDWIEFTNTEDLRYAFFVPRVYS